MHKAIIALLSVVMSFLFTGCCGPFFRGSNGVVALSISPGNSSIQPGGTQQFTATGTFGNGGTGDVTNRTSWSSSDEGIATIDSSGLATGVSYGAVTITGDCQCYQSKVSLAVSTQTVSLTSITVTPANSTINVGKTQQFTATGNYSNNTTQNLTNSVTWNSSDTTTATISSTGLATGVRGGNVTITATYGTTAGTTTLTVQ